MPAELLGATAEIVIDEQRFAAVPEHTGNMQQLVERYGDAPERCPYINSLGAAGVELVQKMAAAEQDTSRGPTMRELMQARKKQTSAATEQLPKPVEKPQPTNHQTAEPRVVETPVTIETRPATAITPAPPQSIEPTHPERSQPVASTEMTAEHIDQAVQPEQLLVAPKTTTHVARLALAVPPVPDELRTETVTALQEIDKSTSGTITTSRPDMHAATDRIDEPETVVLESPDSLVTDTSMSIYFPESAVANLPEVIEITEGTLDDTKPQTETSSDLPEPDLTSYETKTTDIIIETDEVAMMLDPPLHELPSVHILETPAEPLRASALDQTYTAETDTNQPVTDTEVFRVVESRIREILEATKDSEFSETPTLPLVPEQIIRELLDSLDVPASEETVTDIVHIILDQHHATTPLSAEQLSIEILNYLGTHEYKSGSVVSALITLLKDVTDSMWSHAYLGRYALSTSL